MPGVWDALSSRLASDAGFEVLFLSGFATAASHLGLPDFGYLTQAETADVARRACRTVGGCAVVVDGDTGGGNALNTIRTVELFEAARVGAAAYLRAQPPVKPGSTFVYEFTLHQNGTYFYHSHGAMQEMMGAIGLFIVHPKIPYDPPVQKDFGIILQEFAVLPNNPTPNSMSMEFNFFTLNGRAALELAVANETRMRQLHRQGFISEQELDQAQEAAKAARAQLALAQAQLQKDRTNLGYTVIRSPVSGVVVDRQVDVGQTVAASFQTPTLFLIAQDLSKMQIDSSFAEADIGNIRVGQPVRFRVDAFSDRSFQGTVKLIRLNPVTQQNVVTYDVVVAVDNPDRILLPGMTAYVNIVVARRQGVPVVSNAALRFRPVEAAPAAAAPRGREGRTATVYVLENDRLRRATIVPGITDNRYTEVVSGELEPGARVVVEDRQAAAPASSPVGTVQVRLF